MPVHSAGPRLYSSIKFKHLVKHAGSATASRPANIALNLTPFVDMMTILVTFLLMVFSSTGQLLQAQKGLDLPIANARETLQQAPVIIVTKSEITYQGQLVATTESVLRVRSTQKLPMPVVWRRMNPRITAASTAMPVAAETKFCTPRPSICVR